jgi:ABC-2 type transport system permease protein
MTSVGSESKSKEASGHFSELLKVEGKLALREPYGVFGIALPVVLLVLIGFISSQQPGNVAGTGFSVLDLYIPTIMVIGFSAIALGLPNGLIRDREIGWLRRVSTTPVHPSRLLGAQMILNTIFAFVMILIVIFGGEAIFGEVLDVNIPLFVISIALSIGVIFSLGLVVAAISPSQTAGSALGGLFFFGMLFLSGLWIQPAMVGGALATVMYYSPAGAAAQAMLYSIFSGAPPYSSIITMIIYTVVFTYIAVRYFRWE